MCYDDRGVGDETGRSRADSNNRLGSAHQGDGAAADGSVDGATDSGAGHGKQGGDGPPQRGVRDVRCDALSGVRAAPRSAAAPRGVLALPAQQARAPTYLQAGGSTHQQIRASALHHVKPLCRSVALGSRSLPCQAPQHYVGQRLRTAPHHAHAARGVAMRPCCTL